ncbi:cytochrome b [Polynucleobacter sp. JS-Safj-400b-B2]|uniref:cytochrome b n=1 Tax=Polynucleobacter sp. JS-Safj-400b-B2 TaxID=2576921 RepID=UPI001C0AC865|nr:cytochrome b [Polynucleobacter sp. JS-Safj-400b-B2]MBU3624874.1 cytochrome b [Polynucleobacter sp. JS-Safj-400b-B2]
MSKTKYHPASIFFHWFVFVLVISAFIVIELKGQFPKGSEPREPCKTVHGVIGQLIFLAMALRLIVRCTYGVPKPTNPKALFASLATAMHWLLYSLLLISPIFGLLYFQYGGKEIHFFGLVWPQFVAPNPEMKKVVEGIHEFLGNSLYFLIGIHALAGLWQHYVIKDDTLRRMLNKVRA